MRTRLTLITLSMLCAHGSALAGTALLSQGKNSSALPVENSSFGASAAFDGDGTPAPVQPSPSGTTVDNFGFLEVKGGYLMNQKGEQIQLTGMSSHGLQWYSNFMTKSSIKYLRDDWGSTLVRAAMYTEEGGYISNRSVAQSVHSIIKSSIELGIYVLVDWHILRDGNPQTHKGEAKEFFSEIARTYGDIPNILYEICNEPNGSSVSWDGQIKPYARELIPVIRKFAPRSVIIVGTPNYSSQITAVENSLLPYDNIMYTLHFYGDHNGDGQRANVTRMMNKGIAFFVTEWGVSGSSGNGGPYFDEATKWVNFMKEKRVSWANWNFSNHSETSAAFKAGVPAKGWWSDEDLKSGGLFVKNHITHYQ